MNKKTFIIIGVFICLLFAIPMASATDVDVHNGLAIESAAADFSVDAVNNASVEDSNSIVSNAADSSDSNIIPDNNNNLSGIQYDSADVKNSKTLAASNDNVLGADGTGNTFADLQYLIDHASGTLTLDRDFNFVSGSDVDHANGIIINNTLTINGGGHTIDAKNLARIFNISASNVQLNNLILINGKSAENGGAIYIQTQGGETNLENITLKFCEAKNGGGIYTVTPTVMKNITAINCTATGNGGAIFAAADGTDVALDIFNLYNNTALNGGAFYTHGDNIKITNVDAQNNTASGQGGAVYAYGHHLTLDGIKFIKNHAGINPTDNSSGGAIYIEGNMTKVNDCNFTNNSAVKGGAILVQGNNATINLSNFVGHNADEEGGAVYVNGTGTSIDNSTFTNNTSHDDGGAIAWWGNDGKVYNVTCFNNSGIGHNHKSSGGTMSIYGSNISMDKLNITLGYVTSDQGQVSKGGGMFITGNNVNITNSSFTNCSAQTQVDDSSAGALYIIGNNTNVINCNFTNNTAWEDGGAVFVEGQNCTFNNTVFINNTAHNDGGAIEWRGNNGTIYNLTADNCIADSVSGSSKGGALLITGDSMSLDVINITNCHVSGEHYTGDKTIQGGAIFLTGNDCNITNASFDHCYADFDGDDTSGGAMYVLGNNTIIVNANFTNNYATEDGGSLFIEGQNCILNNTVFINSTAHNDGGAIEWQGSNGKIYNLTADNCYADSAHGSSKGGALIITGDNISIDCANISNSYVDGLSSSRAVQGGAIFLTGNGCNVTNSSFTNCSVKWTGTNASGGAMYIIGNNTNVIDSNFTNNSAPSDGGAIYLSGTNATLDNVNCTNNTAKLRGGAIFIIDNDKSDIKDSYFENNHAGANGGAIDYYVGAKNGHVTDSVFINNTADGSGGSIYWNGTDGIVEYCNFTGSRAYGNATNSALSPNSGRGGTIIWLGSHGIIRHCNVDDSKAPNEGSAMYIIGSDLSTYYSNFTNCQSNSSGTIYIEGEYAFIASCYMNNNTVKTSGGGIYVKGNSVTVSNTLINNTTAGSNGAGIYVAGDATTISGSNLTNSKTTAESGGIYVEGDRTTISDCNLENNTAKKDGAGIYVTGQRTTITTSNFTNNSASAGGAIYYTGRQITLSDSNFDKNKASGIGGSVFFIGREGDSILRCNFTNDYSGGFGGAVHWEGSGVGGLIQGCYFENSSSGGHGGGVHWDYNKNGTVDDCTFVNCIARGTKNAGAIYMGDSRNKALNPVISNCLIINCTQGNRGTVNLNSINPHVINTTFVNISKIGGNDGFRALEIQQGDNSEIINCTFENCYGNGEGAGALIRAGSNATIAGNTFINCTSTNNNGGGLTSYAKGVQIFENNTFINNTAASGAGAAYLSNAITSFKNNTFINNTLSNNGNNGGAIQVVGGTLIDNSTFIHNGNANAGGAVYSGGAISVNNSNFYDNYAVNGGAIYSKGITVNSSVFVNNTASNNGGAIKSDGVVYISNSTLMNNTAKEGGAVHYNGWVYVNESSTFKYNKANTGSAIRAGNVNINDSALLENQALFNKWNSLQNSTTANGILISGIFVGNDNILNAICANGGSYNNVNYCGVNGGGLYEESVTNTNDVTSATSYNEVHQIIILEIYDSDNNLVDTIVTFTDANGKFVFDVELADARDYSFKVYHPEDNYYTGAEYTIGRDLSNLIITPQNITHPEDENITFEVTGIIGQTPTGNITVFINDTNGTVIYNNTIFLNDTAQAVLNLPRLNATEYYIYAKYNGDENYLPDNETSIFHVDMAESYINIGIENYTYNETRNITITIPYIEDGKVSVIVSNENYTQLDTIYVTEGTEEIKIELPILDAGEYEIEAIFHGNNNYFPSQNTANFTVYKAASIINVSAENVSGGVNPVVDIHVEPEVATQNINVTVYDEAGNIVAQYEDLGLHDSSYSITLPALPKGKYNVTVHYSGDRNHNESDNDTIFYVTNNLFPIEINATNMTYGEDQIINITVPAKYVPDKLWIKLNWTDNDTATNLGYTIDENGVIRIDTSSLPERLVVGNYTIDVYYEGDDDYLSNSSSFTFEVVKAEAEIAITPENIPYKDIEDIVIEISPEKAQSGTVDVYVTSDLDPSLNITIKDLPIDEYGKVYWNVNETILPVGTYYIEAVYSGNENYNGKSEHSSFEVYKAAPTIVIDVNNIYVGEDEVINITVNPNGNYGVTGNVTILVRTLNETKVLNASGQTTLTLENEVEGYGVTVMVIYNGDSNYNSTTASTHYNVTKRSTETNITGESPISYGSIENLTIKVNETGVTGSITVYVNSTVEGFENITQVFTITEDDLGEIKWNISGKVLPVGQYNVTAVYSGDEKYNGSENSYIFIVEQNDSYEITVEANNTNYRDEQVIIVTVPDNANGTVTIVIEGTPISITKQAENGKAVFTIPNDDYDYLEVHDDYKVIATYNGDSNYARGRTAEDLFNVTKIDSHIKVAAENISFGQIENITVSLADVNASGQLVITITNKSNNSQVIRTQTVDSFGTTDGIIYPFEGLLAGNYTVKVEYSVYHNYLDSEDSMDFEVAKADPALSENSPDITYGLDENITVTITGVDGGLTPTGIIEVIVDGVSIENITIGDNDLEYIVSKPAVDPKHNITVIYKSDSNYNPVTITGEFAVSQNTTIEMEEDSPNIVYGNNETITITLPNDATGRVYLVVNGSYYSPISIDESTHNAVFNITAPQVGEYSFTAHYMGDSNYAPGEISGAFNVTKANVTLAETHAASITYGANNTITVTITGVEGPEGVLAPTGTIKVLVDGVEIGNQTIGTDSLIFTSIKPIVDSQHNITVIYSGDRNYNENTTTSEFAVIQNATVDISEVSPDISYGDNETITVTIAGDATGTITVNVGGEQVGEIVTITEITEEDKVFTFNITKPDGGVYDDLTVVYGGDSNYDTVTIHGEFTVSPIDPNIAEDSPDITYGENETIAITIPSEGMSGRITVTVKDSEGNIIGEVHELTIGEDDLEVNITKPDVGTYNITVYYEGNENYTEKTVNGSFTVSKASIGDNITVVPTNITYGSDETITVYLPSDAVGNITIRVNEYTETLEVGANGIRGENNVSTVFTITDKLLVGNYTAYANYSGSNYNDSNAFAPFHVDKAATTTSIAVVNITYNADETITVTVTGVDGGVIPTGYVSIKVNETVYTSTDSLNGSGQVTFTVPGLLAGNYTVNATYNGDTNYNESSAKRDFSVNKTIIPETTSDWDGIKVVPSNITYPANETIIVTVNGVPGGATPTGNVTITITKDGVVINTTTADLDSGVASFIIPGLVVGEYNVTAIYNGDSNYEATNSTRSDAMAPFHVSPAESDIKVVPTNITYGQNEPMTLSLTVFNASGKVNITIFDNESREIFSWIEDMETGEKQVIYTNTILAVGNYTVNATYYDDENYNNSSDSRTFEVTKASNEITVVPTNITYGQTETITVTVPEGATGNVTITIGTYTDTLNITSGSTEVVFTIPKTAADELLKVNENYVVFANYSGDSNFESAVANAPFHVDPANTTVTIEVANITYGEDEIINVTVTGVTGGDVPAGFVTIRINGTEIELTKRVSSEGKAQFNVTGLVVGEYTVNATFESSSINYNDGNNTAKFNVTKADIKEANMNITAVNITYGDDETITVIFNENNVTGNVTITINGTPIETKELEDGRVVFTVPDLEANGYNVIANYSGDDNYNPISIEDNFNTDFKVDKANVTVVVAPTDIIYKDTEEINVTVTGVFINDNVKDNLTGKVTIYIDGVENQIKEISEADENGILHFNVEGLAVGTHNVTAVYHDDINYNDRNATEDFEVLNALPENMQVIPQNITYHIQNETITVDLGEVLNGTIELYINNTLVATFDAVDVSSVSYNNTSLAVGNYTARAVFTANGDSVEASANFTVSKAPVTVDVVAEDSTYGGTQTITVTVDNTVPDKFNLTGNVSITINGVDYGNKTVDSNGQAVFTIDTLEANENYVVIATYYGDVNYENNNGQDTFKVSKADVKDANKNITAVNITYGDDETITVTLNENNITGKITITINGTEIETKELEDGKVIFTVKDLEVNEYNVVANYSGDTNYNPFTIEDNLNADFTVGKANSTVEVEAIPSIVYGNNETITVTVPIRNHTGTVTLTINGTVYEFIKHLTAEGGDSIVLTNVSGLAVGLYNVTVKYEGDGNYNDSENSTLFEVTQAEPASIVVEPQNITYGQIENITVTVSPVEGYATPSGNVTITIVGTDIVKTLNLTDGSVTFNIPDLEVETYMVEAVYSGDVNYTGINGMNVFKVSPAASNVTIEVANITYGDTEYANITIPNINASGRVIITVDGNIYQSSVLTNDTPINLALGDLAVGEHTIDVEYFGDHNYNDSSAQAVFTVSPANSSVIIATQNITYQDIENITVTVPVNNATGTLVVRINGSEINRTKFNGENSPEIVINVADLAVGEYNVTAEYIDDVNYNNSANSSIFHVDKANITDINLTALNITYGENGTVTITINDKNATGNITIKVNGTEYGPEELVDGTISFNIPDLSAGDYDVTAYYSGDDNYNATEAQTTFNVDKATPTVYAVGTNITYGSSEQITVIVDGKNITGNVTIFIDGDEIDTKDLTQISTGGRAVFNVPGLSGGNHTVVAVYNGDDNHYSSSGEDNFTVSKANPTVDVNTSNIDYGEVENITITVNPVEGGETPTGNVTVTVTGPDGYTQTFEEVPIVDGNITIPMNDLPAGNYSVKVTYNGDENYNAANATGNFSIGKLDPTVNIDVSNITYGENETITVTVTGADGKAVPTGTVNITVNGETYEDQELTDGKVTITVPGLTPDTYPVSVSYGGDENYTSQTGSGEFTVSKANATMNVNTTNIDYGETETITVNITGSGDGVPPTGKVNITVTDKDGNNWTFNDVPIEDGIAKVDAEDLPAGDYDVAVTYPGDDNYNASSVTGSFSVGKVDPVMDLETENITYGESETIKVTLGPAEGGSVPTGTVNITVTDKNGNPRTFTDVPLENGVAEITLSDLAAGNYTVEAKYSGDNDYNADTVSGKFEVEKAVPHVNIYVYDIIYGDVEELRVTCDAPGTIDVIVNDETITVSLDDGYEKRLYAIILAAYNGKARVDLVNLAVGTYPAIARYNGNENYTAASDKDVFHVIKENTTTKISVDDIKVGEDAVINIEVDHDSGSEKINANITVTVDGTDYTVELKDGKGTLTVPGLSAGTHTVNATYPGSHNYTESSNKTSFKVSKHDSSIKITPENIHVGDDETITVKVPKDATGNVTITVNGKDYTAAVKDGKATFTIPGLKAGTYAVNASYSGDDKYKSSKAKGTFKVSKIKPSIDVDAPTIHEGEDGTITVDVPDDATGTITIEIEGRKYTSRIQNGKAVFHISGLSPGKHNIKVYYSGDDKYQSRSVDGGVINVIGDNHGGNHSKHGGINLSDKKTGNPLIMLVLVFFALVIVPFKRSKKDDDEEEN